MSHKCKKCLHDLHPWSKFNDLKSKEGIGLAICGSIINGVDHFWSGEWRSSKQNPDYEPWICIIVIIARHIIWFALGAIPLIRYRKCQMKHAL